MAAHTMTKTNPRPMNKRYLVYVLYFDDASRQVAQRDFGGCPFAVLVQIQSSPYLENIMYQEVLGERAHEWLGLDYVGCVSYKATSKGVGWQAIASRVEGAPLSTDVVALLPSKTDLIGQATKEHGPLFLQVWRGLLSRLGFRDNEVLAAENNLVPFFCNYWLARPRWLKRYIAFQQRVKAVMEEDGQLRSLLYQDAGYEGLMPVERRRMVFGCDHYTFHPFVLERLCCLYFYCRGARVHCGPSGSRVFSRRGVSTTGPP